MSIKLVNEESGIFSTLIISSSRYNSDSRVKFFFINIARIFNALLSRIHYESLNVKTD